MSNRAPRTVVPAALLAALAASAALADGDAPGTGWLPPPLGWQEPAPVARLFLQLPFEAPEPAAPGTLRAGVRVLYSNNILLAESPALRLVTDVETFQPTLQLAAGLGAGLEVRVSLPFVLDWGGVLDPIVLAVDGSVGSSLGDRRARPTNVAEWTLLRADGRGVTRLGAGGGLGDASIGLKWLLLRGGGWVPALSARAALSLPTGRLPWGAGALTPAAGVLAGWRLGGGAVRFAADLAVPTAPLRTVDLPTRPYGTLALGLTAPVDSRWAAQAQVSAHGSPLRATGIDQLDRQTAYVLAGLTARLAGGAEVDASVVENVFSPYRGADIAFLFAVRPP